MNRSLFTVAALCAVLATPAFAHTGAGPVSGLLAGFGHPIGGLDHMLAMVAVGVLAVQQGGKSLWFVPAAFVAMMIVGGLLGMGAFPLPFVEAGIVGSVVVLGAVIALGRQMPMGVAMALAGAFALFHGHAHGTEMPVDASGLSYGLGFAIATLLLHGAGIGLTMGIQKFVAQRGPLAVRISGGAIAAAGAALVAA